MNEHASQKRHAPAMPPDQEKTPPGVTVREGSKEPTGEQSSHTRAAETMPAPAAEVKVAASSQRVATPDGAALTNPARVLATLRRLSGQSQASFARHWLGKTRAVVTHAENGRRNVPVVYLQAAISASTLAALLPFEASHAAQNPGHWEHWARRLRSEGLGDLATVVRDHGAAIAAGALVRRWFLCGVAGKNLFSLHELARKERELWELRHRYNAAGARGRWVGSAYVPTEVDQKTLAAGCDK